tara:strand:+ start:229 stop:420 length:192 start_codon:yes stop_codon:yes gene_type:complete
MSKQSAEEDCITAPISVLAYISELEAEYDALQVKLIATAQELAELKVSNFKKSVDSQHFYPKY